ncbi:RNA polymerase II elongation factor Ell-like isoform X1 [Anopheles albimanus]|uniref:RNA polymerase II elongation factor Ell-like isoform X1 n=1 Tax=Anopheles albimanus TaxID=7167 RepID=UPI00163FB6AA|nr:RNA polymerase II elongation factor Ell-like isoform X1 [Anopheles albimanus]XP_035789630.1 RNA polymerase II elongation factor Ell-like isoform X1 [Anopheles albimanus]XP_035789631.1 RNA polymerase II elongation factor Ell-like isoform X1 [Anopheles albimanus]
MAALSAGSYGLSQQGGLNDENKELIFVKLTDSALRAIEEFQRTQAKLGSSSGNPSIQFLQNGQGCLSFPSGGNNVQKFNFSITDFDTGSIECIQQTQGQLQNMGHIPHKMRIHANDDVYEATRNRFTAAEENQKNKCTREIKPNQNEIGRKGKLKTPNFRNIPNSNAVVSKRDSIYNNSSVNKASSLAASQLTSNNNINSYNNPATSPKLVKTNGVHQPHQSVPQQQQQQQQHQQPQQQNNHHLQHQTQLASVQAKPGYQHTIHDPPNQQQQSALQKQSENANVPSRIANGRKTGNADYMKCNIKERLIHMLALKSYKRPELIVKLQQDGVRKEEMKCTTQILRNISTTRDGMLILHRNIWNEVQDDWPFYSEQDRQAVKRRRPQNLTPPLSSDGGSSASGQSPSSTHNGNSPQSGSKRPVGPGTEETTATPYSKKQRISHYKKDTHPDHMSSRCGINDSRDSSNMNPRSRESDEHGTNYHHSHLQHHHHHHSIRSAHQYGPNLTPNNPDSEDGVSLSFSLVSNDVAKRIESSVCEPEREPYESGFLDGAQQMNGQGEEDFVNQFTRITTVEQRRRYKTEFDNEYKEYRRLHEVLEHASRKFAQYEEDLQHEPKDTPRYKEIQMKIIKEYDRSIKNVKFQQDKERFNYLHKKLSHIKLLVRDYDSSITNGGLCRPQENY